MAGAAFETGVDGNDEDNDDDDDDDDDGVILSLVSLATSGTTSPSLFTSSSLCRVTRSTITPPMLTGRSNATGVSRPVRPTCKVMQGGGEGKDKRDGEGDSEGGGSDGKEDER